MMSTSHEFGSEFTTVYIRGQVVNLTRLEMIELRDTLTNTLARWAEPAVLINNAKQLYDHRGQQ